MPLAEGSVKPAARPPVACHLHVPVHRGWFGAGVQLPGGPAGVRRSLSLEPGPGRVDHAPQHYNDGGFTGCLDWRQPLTLSEKLCLCPVGGKPNTP
jgi:hypothetical protein